MSNGFCLSVQVTKPLKHLVRHLRASSGSHVSRPSTRRRRTRVRGSPSAKQCPTNASSAALSTISPSPATSPRLPAYPAARWKPPAHTTSPRAVLPPPGGPAGSPSAGRQVTHEARYVPQ